MIRWLRSLFAWREVCRADGWSYAVNDITGDRMATKVGLAGAVDADWLSGWYATPWQDLRSVGAASDDGEAAQ